jgi:Domain of unknown function (DUF6968)
MKPTTGMTSFTCVRPNGERVSVTIAVGHPYPTSEGDWACPVEISGLRGRLEHIVGSDSMQALCLAIRTARDLLASFMADGGRILDPETGKPVSLDDRFGSPESIGSPRPRPKRASKRKARPTRKGGRRLVPAARK